MSQEERDWLDWLKRARDGKMTQWEAAERMGVTGPYGDGCVHGVLLLLDRKRYLRPVNGKR